MGSVRRLLLGLYLEVRVIPVLLWSFTGITLGTAIAAHEGHAISVAGYLAAVAVGVLLQGVVAHCVNEIADWRSGTDRDPSPRIISGGSKVIASGLLRPRELVWICAGATCLATLLGVLAAAARGWVLILFGVGGLVGALLYTLPPLRAAYRPFVGETVAIACVWACVAGAYVVQTGGLGGAAALAGLMHGATCLAMLIVHHYLDLEPDARAAPQKRTSVVVLGLAGGRLYAGGLAAAAVAVGVALSLGVDGAFVLATLLAAAALGSHLAIDPGDPASVTRGELAVILLGLAGGLGTAALLAPQLSWALLAPAVLVPIELLVSAWAHRALFEERARLAAPLARAEPGS